MTISAFQFTDPALINLEFSVNTNFEHDESEKVPIPLQFEVHNKRSNSDNIATVKLVATIGTHNDETPYFICATVVADFRWDDGKFSDEAVQNLLDKNAPALLLGYLRPMVASITNFSPFSVHNLPFFDFTQDAKEDCE